MRNLSETFLFNKTNTASFVNEVKKINFSTDLVKSYDLDEQIKVIERRFRYSLLMKVLNAYQSGEIYPLYSEGVNITKLIPIFQIAGENGKPVGIVNIKPYASKDKNGNYNIDNRQLYALLECNYINLKIRENENTFVLNQTIIKLSTIVYVKLMNKILDKMFGINLIPDKANQINYCLGKFFQLYVIGKKPSETVNTIAYAATFNPTDRNMIMSSDTEFSEDAYTNFEAFIENLATHFVGLNKLNVRSFLDNWMIMYGENSVFSIEHFPTMLTNVICASIFSVRINRDTVIENVVGKEVNHLHVEICRVLK